MARRSASASHVVGGFGRTFTMTTNLLATVVVALFTNVSERIDATNKAVTTRIEQITTVTLPGFKKRFCDVELISETEQLFEWKPVQTNPIYIPRMPTYPAEPMPYYYWNPGIELTNKWFTNIINVKQ